MTKYLTYILCAINVSAVRNQMGLNDLPLKSDAYLVCDSLICRKMFVISKTSYETLNWRECLKTRRHVSSNF